MLEFWNKTVVENIYTAINNKELALGIFLDLSTAFDTADHTVPLDKWSHYGFQAIAFKFRICFVIFTERLHRQTKRNAVPRQSRAKNQW